MTGRWEQPVARVAPSPKLVLLAEPEGQRLESEAGVEWPRLARVALPAAAGESRLGALGESLAVALVPKVVVVV
jgi:hypothetical protein